MNPGAHPDQLYHNSDLLDIDQYPITKEEDKLTWENFLIGFDMKDFKISDKDIHKCESPETKDMLIDLRPYMIEQPTVCNKLDFLPGIVNKFRDLHLRHLIVADTENGSVIGMITR